MGKVAIVTIDGNTNFGNRLQNFALQETIARVTSADVETLSGLPRHEDVVIKTRRRVNSLLLGRLPQLGRARRRVVSPSTATFTEGVGRRRAIDNFVASHIKTANQVFDRTRATDIARVYGTFVVGSDQVWNPAFTHGNAEWFLDFAEPSQRVAYAGSFGVPEIPRYLVRRYRRGLLGIPSISVREHSAAELVRKLTGKAAPVVLDPTMLVEAHEWRRLSTRPQGLPDSGYVLVFMLATFDGTRGQDGQLDRVRAHARRAGLEIVDANSPVSGAVPDWSPSDFIGAIAQAELVVTDSFHAAVFSHLFNKPFLIAGRGEMNSRFDTLLSHSGLTDRWLTGARHIDRVSEIDWPVVNDRLKDRRATSLDFLRSALRDGAD